MTRITSTTPMNPARMRLPPRYLKHQGSAHLPASCLIEGKPRRCGPGGRWRGTRSADVVVDEAAVGAEPDELAVVLRRLLQCDVEAVLFARRAAVRADSAGRPCRPSGGRASVSRSASDAVPLSNDSIASPIGSRSCRQAGDEPFEAVDRAGELVAVLGEGVASTVLRLSISCWIDLVVVGQRIRERRRLATAATPTCRPGPGRSAPATR